MADNVRVLIVDDEKGVRASLAQALRGAGLRTLEASSGPKAIELAVQERVDVVVADLKLPGMNGLELLRRLGAAHSDAVVVMTADESSLESVPEALREGAFDYLLRPLDDEQEIRRTIARAVGQHQEIQREALLAESRRLKSVVSTGNPEIDDKMGGGIPIGSLTLIDGHSHAGKSVLSQQMMWGSLQAGFRLSFFTTENTVKSLVKQMQSLNTDILDYLLLRRLKVYPMEVARSQAGDLGRLLTAIACERARGSDIVLVDAVTPFVLSTPPSEVVGFFEGCKRLCSDGLSIVNVIHSHAVSSELLVRITSLCDAHLGLRTEQAGARLIKVMEVAKVRGASRNTGNIVSFEIEPGLGMRIIPLSKAQG